MQSITIDLKKNADMKDFVVDKEPGDPVCLYGTIKSLDDQTLVVTVEEIEEDKRTEEDDTSTGDEGSGDEGATKSDQANAMPDAVRDIGGEMAGN